VGVTTDCKQCKHAGPPAGPPMAMAISNLMKVWNIMDAGLEGSVREA